MRLRWGSHSAWSATGSWRSQKIPETYENRLWSATTRTTQTDAGKLWLRAAICQRWCGAGLLPRLTSRSEHEGVNMAVDGCVYNRTKAGHSRWHGLKVSALVQKSTEKASLWIVSIGEFSRGTGWKKGSNVLPSSCSFDGIWWPNCVILLHPAAIGIYADTVWFFRCHDRFRVV